MGWPGSGIFSRDHAVTNISPAPFKSKSPRARRPTREEAEEAVRTLLAWAGDDPAREGLLETPRRVADAYREYFGGYGQDAVALLRERTFEDAGGYDDLVMLRDVRVESHCEHHMAPFIGLAQVAYIPDGRIAGLSKLARVVEIFAKRLQTQEKLSAEIAGAIEEALSPSGVAVMIEAEHQCMTMRGVHQPGVSAITTCFLGRFTTDASLRERFLAIANSARRAR